MAAIYTAMSIFLCVILSNAHEKTCEARPIHAPVHGQTCETLEYITTGVTPERHHCNLACIRDKACKAIIHDSRHSVCMLLPHTCILLQPQADHVYQSFEHQCTKWVPASHGVPGYWVDESSTLKAYVARMFINHYPLLGKVTLNTFRSIYPNGSDYHNAEGHHEVLVVDASCCVTWVWYDATSGQPLPAGAFVGAFLTATQTSMYVSRLQIQGNPVIGYYDPLSNLARGQYYGSRSGISFDVMVVESLHVINWGHRGDRFKVKLSSWYMNINYKNKTISRYRLEFISCISVPEQTLFILMRGRGIGCWNRVVQQSIGCHFMIFITDIGSRCSEFSYHSQIWQASCKHCHWASNQSSGRYKYFILFTQI